MPLSVLIINDEERPRLRWEEQCKANFENPKVRAPTCRIASEFATEIRGLVNTNKARFDITLLDVIFQDGEHEGGIDLWSNYLTDKERTALGHVIVISDLERVLLDAFISDNGLDYQQGGTRDHIDHMFKRLKERFEQD